ncbi:MAG TPA: hypothetical protein VFM46_04110 [Pseudomonadales bacterium]|nr:hypothetical protein [Pseudomonadales bacterium]
MHPVAQQLMDAHVQHILNKLAGEKLEQLLDIEVEAFCDWLSQRNVDELLREAQISEFIQRNVLEKEPTDLLITQVKKILWAAVQSPLNKETEYQHLLSSQEFQYVVEKGIDLEALRKDVIRAVMESPVYSQLLSDVLYHGIKDFVLEENVIAKKVPGVSSLVKMGQGIMSKMGGVDSAIEGLIKSYIQKNIENSVELSQKFLDKSLDENRIRTVAQQFWENVKFKNLSAGAAYIDVSDFDDFAFIAKNIWNHLRQTDYARQLVKELVHEWFQQWGRENVLNLLENLGVSRGQIVAEVKIMAVPLINEGLLSGFIEERIRAQLEPFYSGEAVTAILPAN